MKVVHVITGLTSGGAETMLFRLLSHTDREAYETQVISLTDIGPAGENIRELGVPVRALEMRRGVPNPMGVLRLARWLRLDPPDIVQTWMYQADLIGGVAAKLAGGLSVVWAIHESSQDARYVKRIKLWTVQACAW